MPLDCFELAADARATPLALIPANATAAWIETLPAREAAWVKASLFKGETQRVLLIPAEDGSLARAVLGLGPDVDALALAGAAEKLPAGTYRLEGETRHASQLGAFAWALGTYAFDRYRPKKEKKIYPRLAVPAGVDAGEAARIAEGVFLARDLVNTPANDMGPAELEAAARSLAARHGASARVIEGGALLNANYPMIHAVGRASARQPRLIDLVWGAANAPKLTLVGKGVCFDSGGLDLKPSSAMLTMKKDMGGAAMVLGLAHMIMDAKLPVRLRVLVPAVENAVSGEAYRPGDILTSRKGLTVEIGNTDAEGRLVLADALAEADAETPALLVDIATLTGAARTATGFELPPFFTNDETLAADLARHAEGEADPMWRLPLWRSYDSWVEGKVADLTNSPDSGMAGAITAALFLKRFVTATPAYVHFDIAAWTDKPKPGRPSGAEAHVIRALYALAKERFGSKTS